jgi:mono/diheme cytochrome c family protein
VRRLTISLAALVAVLAAAGCGGNGGGTRHVAASSTDTPAADGAKVFASAGCGSCHTLAAATSTGTIGPDLDQLKPDEQTVARQVENGGGGMPPFRGKLSAGQIAAVASFVSASAAASPKSVAAQFKPDKTKLSDCKQGDATCFEQAFANLAYRNGPKPTLALFAKMMVTDPTVKVCHRIAHAIGAGSLAHYHGDVGLAFANGSAVCWSGYYHGILERAFSGVPPSRLTAVARKLCASKAVHKNTFILYQCVHGLGHGLMIYTAYDLPRALSVCDRLQTSWDQVSCTGGVFMENLQTSYGTQSPWLRAKDPLYPCPEVSKRHKLYCYLMVTSRILTVVNGDWRKTVAWCRKAEKGWVATCFQSLGRDASGQTLQNPRKILAICRLGGDMESECVYGAARDITSMDAGARRSTGFCSQVPAGMRAKCFEGIGTILGGFRADLAGRRELCRTSVPRRYLADCSRGAGA